MARILANPARLTDEAVRVRQALYRQPALAAVQQRFITDYLAGQPIRRHLVTDALARQIRQPTLVYWGERNRTPPALGRAHSAARCATARFHCARGHRPLGAVRERGRTQRSGDCLPASAAAPQHEGNRHEHTNP